MNLPRRKFIAITSAALILPALQLVRQSESDLVVAMLRARLPDLRMEESRLEAFAKAFLADYKSTGFVKRTTILAGARMLDVMPVVVNEKFLPRMVASPIVHLEQELFRAFFLGTDYLDVYHSSTRTVSFLFIPDPYRVGCANRLARYDD